MLYYPHYAPDQEKLRSLLLFDDEVMLIVPQLDQSGVLSRQHVEEIFVQDETLITLKDPTHRYSGWMYEDGVARATENLIANLVVKTEQEGCLSSITFDSNGRVSSGQDDAIVQRWSECNWRYVAEEKFPPAFKEIFFRGGMALRVGQFNDPHTGEIIEHNGVLCHPELADFVLARMARQASLVEAIPSITFSRLNYSNHLCDGRPLRPDRFDLLQSAMEWLVPNNLSTCNVADFLSIREEYNNVRKHIWRYLDEISKEKHLDSEFYDAERLLNRLREAQEQIARELEYAKNQIGRERYSKNTRFRLSSCSSIILAGVGAYYGGPEAAALTTGAGIYITEGIEKISTLKKQSNGPAKSIAMSIAKIEKTATPMPSNPAVPNYWL